MVYLSATYRPHIQANVVDGTGIFKGQAKKTESKDDFDTYLVDDAVEVTDLNEKVRKAALEQFEAGTFGYVVAGFGGLSMLCSFVVLPVSSLLGYRIANSHWAHAAVAIAAFFVGVACIAMGLGHDVKDEPEIEFFNASLLSQVQNARVAAGRNPFNFLSTINSGSFQYFHPNEILRLMVQAKNGRIIGANTPKKKAECLLELGKLFNCPELTQILAKDNKTAAEWQKIVADWQNLELNQPIEEASKEKNKLYRDAEVAKNITHAPGDLFKGVAGMVEKDDETGAAIVGGMGNAMNYFMDRAVNDEIKSGTDEAVAKIEQKMFEEIAKKWNAAMNIFMAIEPLAAMH